VVPKFVLASGSPRRQQLLTEAGLQFEVVPPNVAEIAGRSFTIREMTTGNAARKAIEVARARPETVVLGADTLVALDGALIGKPANLAAAVRILQRLSGCEHTVCTSVFICSVALQAKISFQVVSQVRFRSLTEAEIRAYLAKIDPLDKAGAYAAQGHGAEIIAQIRGSYTNVVGLPMGETLGALRHFGIQPGVGPRRR
jgi:septum formation protein